MNRLEAIEAVLRDATEPMTCKAIAAEVKRRGLIAKYGKTLYSSFSRDLNQCIVKGDVRFVKVAAGRFALVGSSVSKVRVEQLEQSDRSDAGSQANGRHDLDLREPETGGLHRKKKDASKGFVYILRDDHCKKCVKIGKTSGSLDKRLRQLQTGNPWIREYVSLETSRYDDVERFLHNVIKLISKGKQVGSSEFYRFDPADAKSILMEFKRLLPPDDFQIMENTNSVSKAKSGHVRRKNPEDSVRRSIARQSQFVFENSNHNILACTSRGAEAKGYHSGGGFVVLKGSRISLDLTRSFANCKQEVKMREALVSNGTIVGGRLTRDVLCPSISSAAKFVMATSANGKKEWK